MALFTARTILTVTVLTCVASATLISEEDWTNVARCRTECVTKFVDYPVSDNKCTTSTDCFMCWQMCEKMVSGTWSYLCEPSRKNMCPPGCRTACDDVIFARHISATSDHTDWSFTHPGQTKAPSHDRLLLAWQRPRLHGVTDEPTVVILYVVMWKHGNNAWKYMYTTSELWAQIDGRHSEYQGLAFRVLAVTDNGKIAETSVTYPPKGYTPPVEDNNNLLTKLIEKGQDGLKSKTQYSTDDPIAYQGNVDITTSATHQEAKVTPTSSQVVPSTDDVSTIGVSLDEVASASYQEQGFSAVSTIFTEQTTISNQDKELTTTSEPHQHHNGITQIEVRFYVNIFLSLCVVVLVLVLAVVTFKHHRKISRLTKLQTVIRSDIRRSSQSHALSVNQKYPKLEEADQPVGELSVVLVHSTPLKPVDSHSPAVITMEGVSKDIV